MLLVKQKGQALLIGSGFDGAQEEMLQVVGFAVLERGYDAISYEDPGQPTVVRQQTLGFISRWDSLWAVSCLCSCL